MTDAKLALAIIALYHAVYHTGETTCV
jgi:hypothetical protein